MADAFEDSMSRAASKRSSASRRDGASATATRCSRIARSTCPTERQFVGFDAYKQAIDSGADLVILATPPGFRPMHFEAAVKAGKHIFMEKPVAVDAPGVRRVLAANEEAKKKNLMVAVGLQRRHDPRYIETIKRLQDGAIGDILFTRVYWNGGGLWVRTRASPSRPKWNTRCATGTTSSGSAAITSSSSTSTTSTSATGSAACTRSKPRAWAAARSAPARSTARSSTTTPSSSPTPTARRCSANAATSTAAAIDVSEHAHGTKGTARHRRRRAGRSSTARTASGGATRRKVDNHHQEHHDMFAALRRGEIYNEGDYGAESTITAILGRMATYSGKIDHAGTKRSTRRSTCRPRAYDFAADAAGGARRRRLTTRCPCRARPTC